MDKKFYVVIILVAALLMIFLISFQHMQPAIERQKELLAKEEILIVNGEESYILSKEDLMKISEEDFEAVLDTSATDPILKKYTGIQLKDIFRNMKIDAKDKEHVILSGADGYSVAYLLEEVLKEKNVYIAYMEDGEFLESKDKGGRGPYESIVILDQFSNRRCKWLTRIEVK